MGAPDTSWQRTGQAQAPAPPQPGDPDYVPQPGDPGYVPNMVPGAATGAYGSKSEMDANANPEGFSDTWSSDPRSFYLGGEEDYSADRANQYDRYGQLYEEQFLGIGNQALAQGQANAAQMYDQGMYAGNMGLDAQQYGTSMGGNIAGLGGTAAGQMATMGQQAGIYGQNYATDIRDTAYANAAGMQGYAGQMGQMANIALNRDAIAQGASQAQAQLQSGLNQAQGQSLAMARSGRGWGGSASALSQANTQNASMAQNAVNQAAAISAQEQQAYQQIQMQQRALNDQAALAYQQQRLGALGQAGELAYQGGVGGGQMGMQGLESAAGIYGQGAQMGIDANVAGAQIGQAGYGQGLQGQELQLGAYQTAGDYANQALMNQAQLYGAGYDTRAQSMGTADDLYRTQADLNLNREQLAMQDKALVNNIALSYEGLSAQREGAVIGGITGALGAGATVAASDERVKTDISEVDDPLLDVGAYGYVYKDPEKHGKGRFFGPMAQELERTPAGRSTVITGADGVKMVDTGRLSLVLASEFSRISRELDEMRERSGRGGSKSSGRDSKRKAA